MGYFIVGGAWSQVCWSCLCSGRRGAKSWYQQKDNCEMDRVPSYVETVVHIQHSQSQCSPRKGTAAKRGKEEQRGGSTPWWRRTCRRRRCCPGLCMMSTPVTRHGGAHGPHGAKSGRTRPGSDHKLVETSFIRNRGPGDWNTF